MSDVRSALAHDPKTAAAIAALRTRIAERIDAIVEDLETIHRTIDEVRPVTHTVEALEALEDIDTETWEALEALRGIIAHSGLLGSERSVSAEVAARAPTSNGPGMLPGPSRPPAAR